MTTQEVDLVTAAAANSDQIEAGDFLTGPRVVTVDRVSKGSAEQPVNIHLREFPGRAFRPCKSMIRVLLAAWGEQAQTYVGRRMQLYRDPKVVFGGKEVGGVRISALSHIEKPCTVQLMVTRGRRAPFTVESLAEQPSKIPASFDAKIPTSTLEQCEKARDYLKGWADSEPERVAALLVLVEQREAELAGEPTA